MSLSIRSMRIKYIASLVAINLAKIEIILWIQSYNYIILKGNKDKLFTYAIDTNAMYISNVN